MWRNWHPLFSDELDLKPTKMIVLTDMLDFEPSLSSWVMYSSFVECNMQFVSVAWDGWLSCLSYVGILLLFLFFKEQTAK